MSYFKLSDFNFKDKRVLIRVDFNVTLEHGKILDETRLIAALPTIKHILKQGPSLLILISHLGRPKGRVVEDLRLTPIAERLAEMIGKEINMVDQTVGEDVESELFRAEHGSVFMLENVQFVPGEIDNSDSYASRLASYCDYFVMDAFGQSHRKYATIYGIPQHVPSCAGLLLDKELENLGKVLNPERPCVAIVGGAKADKVDMIEELAKISDKMLIGGVLANTFLLASGKNIGISRYDTATKEVVKEILSKADSNKYLLPVDAVVSQRIADDAQVKVVDIDEVPEYELILDIGPKTIELYKQELAKAKTILWIGPIGAYETEQFSKGCRQIAMYIAELHAHIVIGGGDSAAMITKFGLKEKMSHVSTGGGASLELLGGKKLSAVEALEQSYEKFKDMV